jgi:hypothetical protein
VPSACDPFGRLLVTEGSHERVLTHHASARIGSSGDTRSDAGPLEDAMRWIPIMILFLVVGFGVLWGIYKLAVSRAERKDRQT